jgi:hypothetical protein
MPLSTLQASPRDGACKTQGQDGAALSFPAGLFHPLQHAGLARRTPQLFMLSNLYISAPSIEIMAFSSDRIPHTIFSFI